MSFLSVPPGKPLHRPKPSPAKAATRARPARRGAPPRRFAAVATRSLAAEQETVDIMTGANTDHAIIAAFRGGTSVAAIARRCGRPPRAVEWLLKKAGLKTNDRRRPRADDAGDAAPENPVRSCRRQDLAFQKAMRRAIAAGQEHPPMIGVFKDARPPNAPRLFVPVEISSGCGSPARECADLDAGDAGDAGAAGVPGLRGVPGVPGLRGVPGVPVLRGLPGLSGLPGRNAGPAERSSRDAGSK